MMQLRNDSASFGWPSRVIHWITALFVLTALPFGLWIASQEPSMALIRYYVWHKSLGLTILGFVFLRIFWHLATPPPDPLPSGAVWKDRLAAGVHSGLYAMLLAVPFSGWWASSATGIDTMLFGRFRMPRIAPVSERLSEIGFAIHGTFALILAALIALHVAGAVMRRDGTLRRMLRGRAG